jgi:hypothetical protein
MLSNGRFGAGANGAIARAFFTLAQHLLGAVTSPARDAADGRSSSARAGGLMTIPASPCCPDLLRQFYSISSCRNCLNQGVLAQYNATARCRARCNIVLWRLCEQ